MLLGCWAITSVLHKHSHKLHKKRIIKLVLGEKNYFGDAPKGVPVMLLEYQLGVPALLRVKP